MTADLTELEQRRDQALGDLRGLDQQVTLGEIPQDEADLLRVQYQRRAAEAIRQLENQPSATSSVSRPKRSRGWLLLYVAAGVVAVFAVAVLLPSYVGTRPQNGYVTGNEALTPPPGGAAQSGMPPRDLSRVTNDEMEAVIAQNPEVVGMRLALAKRYLAEENFDKASVHLGTAIKQQPENPEVKAWSGWLLFKIGKPAEAGRFIDKALAIDSSSVSAAWFKANSAVAGGGSAQAHEILRQLQKRSDLPPELRQQVDEMLRQVSATAVEGGS